METRTTMTALALVLGLGISGASAGDASFSELDADGDGTVSRDEFMTYGEDTYAEVAQEGDGDRVSTIDYNEKVKFRQEEPVTMPADDEGVTEEQMRAEYEETFGTLDVDQNEELDEEELAESRVDIDTLDTDDDGVVSREEFLTYGEDTYAEVAQGGAGDRVSTIDYNEKIKFRQEEPVTMPAQDDGEWVTEEQARMDYESTFERLDEDGDGMLTEDELSS